jgi:ABC-type sugar transport system ATPase subunit
MLQVLSLAKTYPNSVIALNAVSLTVAEGETLVLMGPSGAGKTTLLRLLAGLETPSTGQIFWQNREIQGQEPHLRNLAFLSQKPALFPHLNVEENLSVGLRLKQKHLPRSERLSETEIQRKALQGSELLRIESLLKRPVQELSGGEQQRVALGRAVVSGAKLWLLDEPFSQLDAELRHKIYTEFLLLRRQVQATILLITHDRTEALAFADRIGVLGRGRLLQVTNPREIVKNPRHRVVAKCLGWPTMNQIDGKSEPLGGSVFRFYTELGKLEQISVSHERATLGIDPAWVRLTPEESTVSDWLPFGRWRLERILPEADRAWALISSGNHFWHAPLPPGEPNLGSEWYLSLNRDHLWWFDSEGERID